MSTVLRMLHSGGRSSWLDSSPGSQFRVACLPLIGTVTRADAFLVAIQTFPAENGEVLRIRSR